MTLAAKSLELRHMPLLVPGPAEKQDSEFYRFRGGIGSRSIEIPLLNHGAGMAVLVAAEGPDVFEGGETFLGFEVDATIAPGQTGRVRLTYDGGPENEYGPYQDHAYRIRYRDVAGKWHYEAEIVICVREDEYAPLVGGTVRRLDDPEFEKINVPPRGVHYQP